jgi:hypothetical protein
VVIAVLALTVVQVVLTVPDHRHRTTLNTAAAATATAEVTLPQSVNEQ